MSGLAETLFDGFVGGLLASTIWINILDYREHTIKQQIYNNHTFRVVVEKPDHSRAILDVHHLNDIPSEYTKIVGRYFVEYQEFFPRK
jgi:hypothetical protein